MTPTEETYLKTCAAGASGVALLIALYDTLAGDLRRAAEAERRNELEQRSIELTHALMLIGFLEDRISRGNGGELAEQLTGFYKLLRRRILLAQARRSPQVLEDAMVEVLKIRESWQSVELRPQSSLASNPGLSGLEDGQDSPLAESRRSMSWSA